ncbi:preprotein translocase subunit SecF [Desulfocarbo indianensis]|nr:preprotein translocase subunit SecF [Desulfocarbo indianensis]
MELIKPDVNIDFVGKRKWAFVFSALLLLLTVASLFLRGGLNQGIDFAGGILVQVRFNAPTDAAAIKKALTPLGMQDSLVQNFGREGNEFLIRAEKAGLKLDGLGDRMRETLKASYPQGFEVRRVEMVGPKVGKDLRRQALMAIFYAILLIVVYISGRFEAKWGLSAIMAAVLVGATFLVQTIFAAAGAEDAGMVPLIITALVVTVGACWLFRLRYALGAIVALIHDVAITVGVFTLMDKEFTLAIVAALLTIIGYSLNDTIVVFDRIRENLRRSGRQPLGTVINDSVNQTLSRTILTSGTTLVVVAALWILGGGVIEDFAFALLVGIGIGTYSSIFVASPVLLLLPESKPAGLKVGRRSRPAPEPAPQAPAAKAPSVQQKSASRKRKKGGKRR